uniref:CSON002252 protein n=1 Tax=Culicoides sonorensis TaxID=179676 RepID=A0A336K759_CULSO
MRKIRSKLKRKSSNQKWKRGHSSTSNPSKTLHRDRARVRMHLTNSGLNSGSLTSEALNKLNKMSNDNYQLKNIHTPSDDDQSMFSNAPTTTVRSFMSNFTTNTNVSFSKLLDRENLNERQKEMVAVLAASTETIKEQQGGETSTEYFLAFINSLALIKDDKQADPIIGLLNLLIKSVPKAVMQDKFTLTRDVLIKLLKAFEVSENQSGLIDVISCLATLLTTQEFDKWASHGIQSLLHALLTFTTHSKPKIRKAAVKSITYILKHLYSNTKNLEQTSVSHPVSKIVKSYCLDFFSDINLDGNIVSVLHILGLIEHCFPYFYTEEVKTICESLLSLSSSSNPFIRMHCYQALYTILDAEESSLTDVLGGRLISAIYDMQPNKSDVRQTIAWITVLKKGFIFMVKKNAKLCGEMLPRFMQICIIELWPSDHSEVISAVTATLKEIFSDVIVMLMKYSNLKKSLVLILEYLNLILKNPFSSCNKQVIVLFNTVYEVYGAHYPNELKESLRSLANRYSPLVEDRREIENTVLSAIKNMDIAIVLNEIPLCDSKGEISIERSWILPLIREGLHKSSLEYFNNHIIPLASVCLKKWKHLETIGKQNDAHIFELLCCQLWGLFPGFCRQPSDSEKFGLIAKTAGTILCDNLYLRAPVLDGLKELIPSVIAQGKEETVSKFSKNFLPILFNLYINKPKGSYENDLRVSILDIVKLFLKITPTGVLNESFNTALTRLKLTKEGEFSYNMIFDIVECFAIYITPDQLDKLYEEYVKPILQVSNKKPEEKNVQPNVKKAYRVIFHILSNEHENCLVFVKEKRHDIETLLMKSEELNGDNVRLTRLGCLKYLIKGKNHDSDLIRQCITETVLCHPNNSDRPNQLCTEMIKIIGTLYKDNGKLNEFIELVLIGFTSDKIDLVVKTIWSLNNVLQLHSDSMYDNTFIFILENLCNSVQSNNRMEAKSALCTLYTFVKHTPRVTLTSHLEVLIKTMSKMVSDTKRFCRLPYGRLLKKLCRYYSVQEITRLIPGNDLVTHKRLKKIRKDFNKIKNQQSNGDVKIKESSDDLEINQKLKTITINEVLKDSDSSDVNDSDLEEQDKIIPATSKKDAKMEICIRENSDSIIDLTDVNTINKVSIKNNRNKNKIQHVEADKKFSFRTASDGRLIIEEPKKNRTELLADKKDAKRIRDHSDSSESEEYSKSNKSELIGHKRKKIMGIHRVSVNSHLSGRSGKSSWSQNSALKKSSKKEQKAQKNKQMQPYAYIPLTGSINKKPK